MAFRSLFMLLSISVVSGDGANVCLHLQGVSLDVDLAQLINYILLIAILTLPSPAS